MYEVLPDVAACRPGVLTQAARNEALTIVNTIRALHRLPPLVYVTVDEQQAQDAALMMAANNKLDHNPPTSWACYTAAGATGAATSNLYGGTSSPNYFIPTERIFASLMDEVTNLVTNNVGHRRWILDPFGSRMSFGRVAYTLASGNGADFAAMKVFNFTGNAPVPTSLPPFVAYPYGDYPARFFDTRALLSFSAIPDATSSFANSRVDYSGATVTVKSGDSALAVSNISYDTVGYGVPNNIQFAVAGLQPNVRYDVTIANVLVRGAPTSYNYTFRIVP